MERPLDEHKGKDEEGPIPIFVIGCARSGTTSLANLVASHKRIAGVQHALHHGNIECPVCYHDIYWGDLSRSDKLVKFATAIASDDFFQVANGDVNRIFSNRPDRFFDAFLDLMDECAKDRKARFWVVKFDMLFFSYPDRMKDFLNRIELRYGSPPKFIGIERDWEGYLRSYLKMEGPQHAARKALLGSLQAAILGIARHAYYNRCIRRLVSDNNGALFRFEQFRDEQDAIQMQIANLLEIAPDDFSLATKFERNTSYVGKSKSPSGNYSMAMRIAKLLEPLLRIPLFAKRIVFGVEGLRRIQYPVSSRLLEFESCPQQFRERLMAEGAYGLLELFEKEPVEPN